MHDSVEGFALPVPAEIAVIAERLRLLADPTRLTVAFSLLAGESNPGCLAELADVAQPALSQHLSKMRLGGAVRARRSGQKVFYELADPAFTELVRYLLAATGAGDGGSDRSAAAGQSAAVPA